MTTRLSVLSPHLLVHPPAATSTGASTLIGAVIGALIGALFTLVGVYVANKLAEKREDQSRQALEALHRADREATEQVHQRNREDDLHREQLRELRPIVDDATRALADLSSAVAPFLIADARAKKEQQGLDGPRPHMMEERTPSTDEFKSAYQRALNAHHCLLLRVEWNDTLHSPVGEAVGRAQEGWNAVVHETHTMPLDAEVRQRVQAVNQAAQRGYRDLQETARKRFAPSGVRGSERALVHLLTVKDRQAAEPILAALRDSHPNRTQGPTKEEGWFTIRDSEADPGEARAALEAELARIDTDWHGALEFRSSA